MPSGSAFSPDKAPAAGGAGAAAGGKGGEGQGEEYVDYAKGEDNKGPKASPPRMKGGPGTKRPEEGGSIVEGVGRFVKGAVGGVWGRMTGQGRRR